MKRDKKTCDKIQGQKIIKKISVLFHRTKKEKSEFSHGLVYVKKLKLVKGNLAKSVFL